MIIVNEREVIKMFIFLAIVFTIIVGLIGAYLVSGKLFEAKTGVNDEIGVG